MQIYSRKLPCNFKILVQSRNCSSSNRRRNISDNGTYYAVTQDHGECGNGRQMDEWTINFSLHSPNIFPLQQKGYVLLLD